MAPNTMPSSTEKRYGFGRDGWARHCARIAKKIGKRSPQRLFLGNNILDKSVEKPHT